MRGENVLSNILFRNAKNMSIEISTRRQNGASVQQRNSELDNLVAVCSYYCGILVYCVLLNVKYQMFIRFLW